MADQTRGEKVQKKRGKRVRSSGGANMLYNSANQQALGGDKHHHEMNHKTVDGRSGATSKPASASKPGSLRAASWKPTKQRSGGSKGPSRLNESLQYKQL